MNRQDIANVLKKRRKELKISISDVIDYLSKNGFAVKASTIYGWENGRRTPDIDQFVMLCRLYGIDNLTSGFSLSSVPDSIVLNKKEKALLSYFRSLTPAGQDFVLEALDLARMKYGLHGAEGSENIAERKNA